MLISIPKDDIAELLEFLDSVDLRVFSLVCKTTAEYLEYFHVWKKRFCHHWQQVNYRLHNNSAPVRIDPRIARLFKSESDCFLRLAHGICPVPSAADIHRTNSYTNCTPVDHLIKPLEFNKEGMEHSIEKIIFAGQQLGGDRAVRANHSFPKESRVAMYSRQINNTSECETIVTIVSGGYFELSIDQKPQRKDIIRYSGLRDCIAIGLATSRFHLIDKQPGYFQNNFSNSNAEVFFLGIYIGWDSNSYGYHGDDGKIFESSPMGEIGGEVFGAGDTVGCGLLPSTNKDFWELFYTKNGERISATNHIIRNEKLYPVVGIDSALGISFNFGQRPFLFDGYGDLSQNEALKRDDIEKDLVWSNTLEVWNDFIDCDDNYMSNDQEQFNYMEDANEFDYEDEEFSPGYYFSSDMDSISDY